LLQDIKVNVKTNRSIPEKVSSMSSLRVLKAPSKGNDPYVLPLDEGETWAIVGSKSIMRFLATGEITENAFAVMQTKGDPSRPVMPQ
jgi:hypothetical protein